MSNNLKTEIKRINGYLREITTFFDDTGKPIHHVVNPLMVELKPRDVLQIFVGSFLIASPLSFTEEVWVLSQTLPAANVLALVGISLVLIISFIYFNFYRFKIRGHVVDFVKRVLATYIITASSVVLILALIDKFPIFNETSVALNRVVIVSFPALFGAVISDYLK